MSLGLLLPLGLLALLTIPALIIIYIIKPNYQLKHVSSTYVWKLSLKYKKRKIPVNKIRNILLFLCQLLILTGIALIIARPALFYDRNTDRSDVIAIIDSSASMYTQSEGETRFHRAVNGVIELSDSVFADDGAMSVILADESPEYLATRIDRRNRSALMDTLQGFLENETACSYGTSDIGAAIKLCEDILGENPAAKIYLYTDTSYGYVPDGIEVVPVTGTEEWNAAILNAKAEIQDGYYMLTVEVACYGKEGLAMPLTVDVQVTGANANLSSTGVTKQFSQRNVECSDGKTQTIIFRKGGGEKMDGFIYMDLDEVDGGFTSYDSISIKIDEQDSFLDDNSFQIYGGRKEIVNILYSSTVPNPFFTSALDVLANDFRNVWDLRINSVERRDSRDPFETHGYDLYIYEHAAPDRLPTDGVVFLVDPDRAPEGAGFNIIGAPQYNNWMYLSSEESHPLTKNMSAERIFVTRLSMLYYESTYHVLMSCETNPMLLVRDEGAVKTVVMPFSVHYSNIAELPEFYIMLYNMMNYFIPGTVSSNSYEVGEQFVATPRGPTLTVFDAARKELGSYEREEGATSFAVPLKFNVPGVYILEQSSYFDGSVSDTTLFVKAPEFESNIWRQEDVLAEPVVEQKPDNTVQELAFWLAVALVVLLFAEWLLQWRGNI